MSMKEKVMVKSGQRMTRGTGTTGVETGYKAVWMPLPKVKEERAKEEKEEKVKEERAKVARLDIISSSMLALTRETKVKAREKVKIVTNADMKATWLQIAKWSTHFRERAIIVGNGGTRPRIAEKARAV